MPDSAELGLAECHGRVLPYDGKWTVFNTPLIKTERYAAMPARSSGKRSALLNVDGPWYKIKGVAPTDARFEGRDTPVGGQKADAVMRELAAADVMAEYGRSHDIPAPMEPVCAFDYEKKFLGNDVYASVLKVRGDFRLSEFASRFCDLLVGMRQDGVREAEELRRLVYGIGDFLGFWYGGFERAGLCWGTIPRDDPASRGRIHRSSAGMHNIAFYTVVGGIDVGMVDLGKSCASTPDKVDFEVKRIRNALKALDGGLYFLEHGRDCDSIVNWISNYRTKTISPKMSLFAGGFDPYGGVPEPKEFESIMHFERGRRGSTPKALDKATFYDVVNARK
ncbi:MAG: hypothetical protein NT016_00735 [Candidatus Aenigmarchaeota archaeon]|nr:hypothetical protein [Candidatus Aenigmarchaeota archaeon]